MRTPDTDTTARPDTTLIEFPDQHGLMQWSDGTGRFNAYTEPRTGKVIVLDFEHQDLRLVVDNGAQAQFIVDMIVNAERAAHWTAAELHSANRKEESWQNSDTDGALTQWAHGCLIGQYRLQARIEMWGGRHPIPALFDLDGNLVAAKRIAGNWGMVWGLLETDDPQSPIVQWVNESQAATAAKRIKMLEGKGFRIGTVLAPAVAALGGGATPTAYAKLTGPEFSRSYEILATSGWDTD